MDSRKNRDRLEPMGIWFRLYHKGKLVGEYRDIHDDIENTDPQWEEEPISIGEFRLGS